MKAQTPVIAMADNIRWQIKGGRYVPKDSPRAHCKFIIHK